MRALEFVANLVGIVGGVITVINLVGMTVGWGQSCHRQERLEAE